MEDDSELTVPKAGDVWFVQLPGQMIVDEVYVLDMSEKTCRLRDTIRTHVENRYKIDEIKWIEQSDREFKK